MSCLCIIHSSLKGLMTGMMKIESGIRWLSSVSECGLGEIFIHANEALTMASVFGNRIRGIAGKFSVQCVHVGDSV